MRARRAALLALLCLAAGMCACQRRVGPAAPAAAPAPAASWPALADEYLESYFKAHPSFAAQQGRHEYDGLLPDWSAAGIRAEVARLRAFRERVTGYPDAELTDAQRFERDYLLSRIDRDLFWSDVAAAPFRNPTFYIGMDDGGDSLDPSVYVLRPYAAPEVRLKAFIRYAGAVARAVPEIRRNLRTPLPATYIKLGVSSFGGLAEFYRKDVPHAFAGVGDAALQAELKAVIAPAAAALDGLVDWLKSESPHATGSDPLGADLFAAMLRMTEGVELPLAAIEAAGRADLERNTAALKQACRSFAPGAGLRGCVARMSAHKAEGGAVAGARTQLTGLRQFIIDKDVVSIPVTDDVKVEESPPFNRETSAYSDIPGPYDRDVPTVYYISPPDPAWSKAEQFAYVPGKADLLFGSIHEIWPGHFLQFMWSRRAPSKLQSVFYSYAFVEGWAHYGEELMWEKGLGGDPETHVAQLSNALYRDVRLLSAIGVHTRGMSIGESERLFRDLAFKSAGEARQEAARASYDPAYLNYTLGKLMIRRLRSDYCASRGGEAAWKAFHDALLARGSPPLPLLRRVMLPGDHGSVL